MAFSKSPEHRIDLQPPPATEIKDFEAEIHSTST
jgi:hypothetical protein